MTVTKGTIKKGREKEKKEVYAMHWLPEKIACTE